MRWLGHSILALTVFLAFGAVSRAGGATEPAGDPVVEPSSCKCLGFHWIIKGDDDKKAHIDVSYRKVGTQDWKVGPPLYRVERGTMKASAKGSPDAPIGGDLAAEAKGGWIFAGSIVDLPEATNFEVKLSLVDPGGANVEKVLKASTIAEPVDPQGPVYHVVPGNGGGKGTKADPYKGIEAAEAAAKPGDTFLLHAGAYPAWVVKKSGEDGKPILWKGAGDGEAVIDGMVGPKPPRTDKDFSEEIQERFTPEQRAHWLSPRAVEIVGMHDVWFENFSIRNAEYGIVGHNSYRLVIRHCHIYLVNTGITATKNEDGKLGGFFFSDNVVEGGTNWPHVGKIPDDCGIWFSGEGNIVCYNYVHNFGDGIQTMRGKIVQDIDVYNNDVRQCTDDGLELKDTFRNVRIFDNRLTNVLHPISIAPVNGGPQYIYRNALYNMEQEPYKIHNSPSGVMISNNTIVEQDSTLGLWTPNPAHYIIIKNDLYVANGTSKNNGPYVFSSDAKTLTGCVIEYCGFDINTFDIFCKWEGKKYKTLADAQAKGLFGHCVVWKAQGMFAANVEVPKDFKVEYKDPPDLRLSPKSPAVGIGEEIPGFTQPGKPVDLGAYQLGSEPPHYGPRPEGK